MTQNLISGSASGPSIPHWVFLSITDEAMTRSAAQQLDVPVWTFLDFRAIVGTHEERVCRIAFQSSARPSDPKRLPGKSLREVLTKGAAQDRQGLLAKARKELAEVQRAAGVRRGLKQYRLIAGMSQAQLAARLGTSQSYVARLEKGTIANPKLDRLNQISKILNVSVENLSRAFHA